MVVNGPHATAIPIQIAFGNQSVLIPEATDAETEFLAADEVEPVDFRAVAI